jgi:hypothetical protein
MIEIKSTAGTAELSISAVEMTAAFHQLQSDSIEDKIALLQSMQAPMTKIIYRHPDQAPKAMAIFVLGQKHVEEVTEALSKLDEKWQVLPHIAASTTEPKRVE